MGHSLRDMTPTRARLEYALSSLGIIDLLTPGSLTGGKHVAVTGTMSLDGSVGPIGGVQQKTFLAERNGVDLFLVDSAGVPMTQQLTIGSDARGVPVLYVKESALGGALASFANAWRRDFSGTVVGITGSNGQMQFQTPMTSHRFFRLTRP